MTHDEAARQCTDCGAPLASQEELFSGLCLRCLHGPPPNNEPFGCGHKPTEHLPWGGCLGGPLDDPTCPCKAATAALTLPRPGHGDPGTDTKGPRG